MADYTFDVAAFRVSFPAFVNTTTYPNATLQMNWDNGTCYIANQDYGNLAGACRLRALNLMTAHLTALGDIIAGGQVPGLVQAATVDKVNVSLTPPPVKTQFAWWLSLTPYGQQLLALLQVKSVGGFLVGGSPQRAAFRGLAGGFGC